MIACEIQLRYVIRDKIRDKIQYKTKSSPRQFFFFVRKKNFVRKKIVSDLVSDVVSDFHCTFFELSDKSMLIITKRYIHTAIIMFYLFDDFRCIVGHLDTAIRDSVLNLSNLTVLTDATNQKIALKKWIARECKIQVCTVTHMYMTLCIGSTHARNIRTYTALYSISRELRLLLKHAA